MKSRIFKPELESLRGIAAFAVALTHGVMFFQTSAAPETVDYTVLRTLGWTLELLPAGGAVVLFFVLSGHVLAGGILSGQRYLEFVVRRIFRIFPAMIVAMIAMFVLRNVLLIPSPPADVAEWCANVFWPVPTVVDLLRNVVVAKVDLVAVTWTMIPELVCSAFLPGVIWLHLRTNTIGRFCLLAALMILSQHADQGAVQFGFCFYAGLIIPEALAPLIASRLQAMAIGVAGYSILGLGNHYGVPYYYEMRVLCGLGAALLITSLVGAYNAAPWLDAGPLRFLGRVSFSFYLLHLPALYALAYFVMEEPNIPRRCWLNVALAAASIAVALIAAAFCYRFVELPGIAAGRAFASRLPRLGFLRTTPA